MYDYVDGKADWMAYGLPVEGDDGPFLGQRVAGVTTCTVTATVGDARRALDASGDDEVVLVHGDGLAVGRVDAERLAGQADDVDVVDVMEPVPSTVRPSVTVAAVSGAGGGRRLVTTSDGRLLGAATVEEDRDDPDDGDDRIERELHAVLQGVEERFGDREPSPDELRAFLRDRLVSEGRSGEEADRFLDRLDVGDGE